MNKEIDGTLPDPRQSWYAQFFDDECGLFHPGVFALPMTDELAVGAWVIEFGIVPGGHYVRVVQREHRRVVFAELLARIEFSALGCVPLTTHHFRSRLVFTSRRRHAETAFLNRDAGAVRVVTDLSLHLVTPNRMRYFPPLFAGGCRLLYERQEGRWARPQSVVSVGWDIDRNLAIVRTLHEFETSSGHVMPLVTETNVSFEGDEPPRPSEYRGPRLVYSAPSGSRR